MIIVDRGGFDWTLGVRVGTFALGNLWHGAGLGKVPHLGGLLGLLSGDRLAEVGGGDEWFLGEEGGECGLLHLCFVSIFAGF